MLIKFFEGLLEVCSNGLRSKGAGLPDRYEWRIQMNIIQKVFGTHSERELKRIEGTVKQIEDLRPSMQALSDTELAAKTEEFKKRLGVVEATNNLLTSNLLNLFIIQSLGILLYIIFRGL